MATTGVIKLEETCIMCPRRGSKIYCQKMDWKNHKILCSSFKNPKPETDRPGRFFRRGLFFPGGSAPAQFVWVECWTDFEDTEPICDQFDRKPYFGQYGAAARTFFSEPNPVQARDMTRDSFEFGLHFWCLDLSVAEPPNLGLRTMTRGQACAPNFRGPILVVRHTKKGRNKESYVDIDMRDVRNTADHFSWMYREGTGNMAHLKDQRVLATGCLCPQDQAQGGSRSKFVQQVIDTCDSIFAAGGSGIANLLGIPLSLRLAQEPRPGDSRRNREAMLLMRDITSTTVGSIPFGKTFINRNFIGEEGFGSSPDLWNDTKPGCVLIARADGVPLLKEHVEALCAYIENKTSHNCPSPLSVSKQVLLSLNERQS
ncbi:hypothetical protein LTR20_005292 [Exophiala xenobiotica]|nr:hypothetical protein LTS13_001427 [Exophiala xenobiotica]KAK5394131.1 hypothetical protein LTR79_008344 [Exophiala xenobiotica]KAK5406313.1 hypothetical protein LTR90_010571 [Exophiala xenobiotica]KAK5447319.1 hypothetical protein LTR18_002898 [Exophiala xenobiotica]KAK5463211.1 hypothetical protein LTR20_005292 [Exophiala xenobiotica]